MKHFILLSILFISFLSYSQQDTLKYWIQFTDKSNSTYSISSPQDFLSQKAIDRRSKRNIPIIENDIPVNQNYIDSVTSTPNVWIHNTSKWMNSITVSSNDTNVINLITTYSFVNDIEKVKILIRTNVSDKLPNEITSKSLDSYTVTPHYPYGKTYNQLHLHKMDYLHDLGFLGQGMTIAIIDAGFLNANSMKGLEHLFEEDRVLSTKDFVDHDGDVYSDHSHGASVLSIIAGDIPEEYRGTAPKAKFHLLRSEDAQAEYLMEEDNWVSAAEYADSVGADIINTSLGYTTFDDTLDNHTYADLDGHTTRVAQAVNIAFSKGMMVVVSAGNSGSSDWGYISTPADADSALTIGAVDSLGNYAPFSSYGPSYDGDVKPNITSVGWQTYYITPWSNEIAQSNGTSFSAPMVTGMVACLWQALPDYSPKELKLLIEKSSHQYAAPDSLMGYGIPNFYDAYHQATGINYTYSTQLVLDEIFPNPLKESGTLTMNFISSKDQEISIEVINSLGQSLQTISPKLITGRNLVEINYSNWKGGVYLLRIIDADKQVQVEKVVVGD